MMNFIRILFKLFSKRYYQLFEYTKPFSNETFGALTLKHTKNIYSSGFSTSCAGKIRFAPTSSNVQIVIVCSKFGPDQHQRDSYQKLCAGYPKLLLKIEDYLNETIGNYQKDDCESMSLQAFDLSEIFIHKYTGHMKCYLTYIKRSKEDYEISVDIYDMEVNSITIENPHPDNHKRWTNSLLYGIIEPTVE